MERNAYNKLSFYFSIDTFIYLVYYIYSTLDGSVLGRDNMNVKFNNEIPIYIQIMNYLKNEIILGKINKGSKLPSIRELSNQFKVNSNTVQRVYKEMEREGIVYVQRGMGTFIEDDATIIMKLKCETAEKTIDEFITKMKNIGFSNDEIIGSINNKIKK